MKFHHTSPFFTGFVETHHGDTDARQRTWRWIFAILSLYVVTNVFELLHISNVMLLTGCCKEEVLKYSRVGLETYSAILWKQDKRQNF